MTRISLAIVAVVMLASGLRQLVAEEANGLRLMVQKTMLDSEKDRDEFNEWDKVKKAYALRCDAKNISFHDFPAGKLEWTVILKKWGQSDPYYRYKGTEEFPALLRGASSKQVVGKIPIDGYEMNNSRSEYVDSIEAYRVVISHDGKETINFVSSSAFAKLDEQAKDVKTPGNKGKKGKKK